MAFVKGQAQQNCESAVSVPERDDFLRVPYDFCKSAKRISDCLVRSVIYSFSCVKNNPQARCAMSFSRIEERLRYSRSTVNLAIHSATKLDAFDQDKSNRFRASYKYLPPEMESDGGDEPCVPTLPSFTVEFYLLHTTFKTKDGKAVYLPKSAAMVLGLIKTHDDNGGFEGSVRGIARTLGRSPTTIQKAIDLLLDLKLIFRPKEDRGINASYRSRYTVNKGVLRRAEKTFDKKVRRTAGPSAKQDPVDEAADRERYYARLQWAEKERAESFERILNSDSRYHSLHQKIKELEIKRAKAEIFTPPAVPGLDRELDLCRADRAKRMAELGISEEDLRPKFLCPKCEDTGVVIGDGRFCDCYLKRRRT